MVELSVVSLALLFCNYQKSAFYYQFPFLAGCVFLGWAVPQLFSIDVPAGAPSSAIHSAVLMCLLCILAIVAGDRLGSLARPRHIESGIDLTGYTAAASGLTLLGVSAAITGVYLYSQRIANHEVLREKPEAIYAIALLLLALTLKYGVALSWLLAVQRSTRLRISVLVLGTAAYLVPLLFMSRRGMAIDLAFFALLSVWFVKKWHIPTWSIMPLVLVAALLVSSVDYFRSGFQIGFFQAVHKIFMQSDSEMRNCALVIWDIQRRSAYTYGLADPATVFFSHFPGQMVGWEIRQSIMPIVDHAPRQIGGFALNAGISISGMGEAFRAFGFWGALIFMPIATGMRICYDRAMNGSTAYQWIYLILLGPSLQAITHGHYSFLIALLHASIFTIPVLWWTGRRSAEAKSAKNNREFQIASV